jgi:elongation factor G
MKLEVVTPEQFLGDIISDLSSRRARIESIETQGEMSTIHVFIPLSETFWLYYQSQVAKLLGLS